MSKRIIQILLPFLFLPILALGQTPTQTEPVRTQDELNALRKMREEERARLLDTRQDMMDKREGERQEMEQKQETLRERMLNKSATTSAKLDAARERFMEVRKARIQAFFGRMLERLQAAFDRLARLVERLESRIAKLEEVNKNISTDEAKAKLAEAKAKITEGKNKLAEIKTKGESLVGSDELSAQELFKGTRELIGEAVDALREAHQKIVEAVRSIKAQVENDDDSTATSTNEN